MLFITNFNEVKDVWDGHLRLGVKLQQIFRYDQMDVEVCVRQLTAIHNVLIYTIIKSEIKCFLGHPEQISHFLTFNY